MISISKVWRLLGSIAMLIILATGALADDVSNHGLDKNADALDSLVRKKINPSSGGGSSSHGGTPTPIRQGAPASIVIVTQPPQTTVKLETGNVSGSTLDKPDVSRYPMRAQAGKRRLVVSKQGWQTRELIITLVAGDNAPVLVTLQRDDYSTLFKELIQVYTAHYEANHDDGVALLHLIYLNRLMKNYREVDRLGAELRANPRIDVREETVKLERYAMDAVAAVQAQHAKADEAASGTAEPEPTPEAPAPIIALDSKGNPIPGAVIKTRSNTAPKSSGASEEKAPITFMSPFFYPGMVGYLYNSLLGNPDTGIYYLRAALEMDLSVPLLWYDTGLALSNQAKFQDSFNSMEQAYHIDPEHAWVLAEKSYLCNLLGRVNGDKKMITDAEYFGQKAIEKDPKYMGGYLNLVTYYQVERKFPQAEGVVRQALSVFPTNPQLISMLGDVRAAQGDLAGASQSYDDALMASPNFAYALYGKGKVAEAQQNWAVATEMYNAAIAADAEFPEPLMRLAYVEETQKNEQGALDHYYQATQINPGLFDPWYRSGMILYNHKQWAEAGKYLYKAFELNPYEPWTLFYL
ncbi:MAG: tetratricopeptide repeat protein, partial [bacterium]